MQKIFTLLVCSILIISCKGQLKQLDVGDTIPMFSLKNQNDSLFNVADYIGKKKMVIYFYPKDESPVCTKEACSFRDSYTAFTNAGAIVVGINSGSVKSHHDFITNHQLPFTLLSDPDNKVLKMFGVKGKFFLTGRKTFVVDLTGKIVYTFDSFSNGSAHSEKTLGFLQGETKIQH
ncbi:peroxiredoxin [Chitinophagaceae bacterium 26-R-25]|nr:peroxiredoxin [Chitinophagaceae bacterium 26-R-25]